MDWKYCYLCGSALRSVAAHAWICKNNHQLFRNPKTTVGIVLLNTKNEFLVAIRGEEPGKGKFDLPGGFVDAGESAEEALIRELHEELAINKNDVSDLQLLTTNPSEYLWGDEVVYACEVSFFGYLKDETVLTPQSDVAEIKWFDLPTFNEQRLYFSPHQKAVKLAKRLEVEKRSSQSL